MFETADLTKTFGTNTAVARATIRIDRPSFVGIIGRSGAGKSTLLRMINRLTDATSGRVLWKGQDVTALQGSAMRAWQSQCAMIFQQFNLVPEWTLSRTSCTARWPARDALDPVQPLPARGHPPRDRHPGAARHRRTCRQNAQRRCQAVNNSASPSPAR